VTVDFLRANLFAAVLIALGGYLFVFRPLEATVAQRYADLDAGRTTLERELALARRIPALTRERAVLDAQLGRVHLRAPRSAAVERFLRTIADVAARDGVAVERVASDASPMPGLVASARAPAPLFDELGLDVALRGGYADLIRAVRELNGGDAARRINLTSLGNADRRPGVRPQLDADFHVFLLREADESTTTDARPR
jgi:hypothetical protein